MSRKAICWWTLDDLARTLFLWLELANTKPQLHQIFLSLHKAGFICNPSPLLLEGKGQEIKGYFLLGRSCKKNLKFHTDVPHSLSQHLTMNWLFRAALNSNGKTTEHLQSIPNYQSLLKVNCFQNLPICFYSKQLDKTVKNYTV